MRAFGLPSLVDALSAGGLADSVYDVAERGPEPEQSSRRSSEPGGQEWYAVTAAEFRDEVPGSTEGYRPAASGSVTASL
ncbi:hypothetical protein SUDANB15_00511 [Streptomyces sp. enrichment culture]